MGQAVDAVVVHLPWLMPGVQGGSGANFILLSSSTWQYGDMSSC